MSERYGRSSMDNCTLPKQEKQPREGEYIRVDLCGICSSDDDVQLVACPDYDVLHLCKSCRVLFGFTAEQGVDDGNN